jgi:uncharacterized protein YndB with AHSA1/START domain
MTAKAETQSVSMVYELPHPPAKVWRTLTEPELLARWVMANDMKPVVGHRFTFKVDPTPWWDGIVECEVLEVETHRRLRYSWRGGPRSQVIDTVVTWTLTPTPTGGTRLALEQAGFLPTNKFAFGGADKAWHHMLGERLRDLLELPL